VILDLAKRDFEAAGRCSPSIIFGIVGKRGLVAALRRCRAIQFCRSGLGRERRRGDVTAVWRRPSSFVEVALCHLLSCLPHSPKCPTRAMPKASATAWTTARIRSWSSHMHR